jgi:serum/glucocorticoid-regulated kinase 2
VLSAKVTKINQVNKFQDRIILLTDRNLCNLLPSSNFFAFFSRIKRKISWAHVTGMTVSRFGQEFVVHVDKEHDYRFTCQNMKMKIVETIVDLYCRYHRQKMTLYYHNDLTLENFTTTIFDLQRNVRKKPSGEPLFLDPENLKVPMSHPEMQLSQARVETHLPQHNGGLSGELRGVRAADSVGPRSLRKSDAVL